MFSSKYIQYIIIKNDNDNKNKKYTSNRFSPQAKPQTLRVPGDVRDIEVCVAWQHFDKSRAVSIA